MKEGLVEFKGLKEGLVIYIKEKASIEEIKESIQYKLGFARDFFRGAKIKEIYAHELSDLEILELKDFVKNKCGIDFEEFSIEKKISSLKVSKKKVFSGISEGKTKFVMNTLRSGMKVDFDGNIVVIGDVNPGAQVIAQGNIVVLGNLRGMVYAGSNGNQEAFVVANNLQPVQLRISDFIAIPPDGKMQKPNLPEKAFIKDGYIVIEIA